MDSDNLLENQQFNSKLILNKFIKDYSRIHGFNLVIKHSNKKAIYYNCNNRLNSNLICTYSIVAYYSKFSNIWTLKIKNNDHNHDLIDNKNNKNNNNNKNLIIEEIINLHKDGHKPSFIEKKILNKYSTDDNDNNNNNNLFTIKFIYSTIRNYKKRLKRSNKK